MCIHAAISIPEQGMESVSCNTNAIANPESIARGEIDGEANNRRHGDPSCQAGIILEKVDPERKEDQSRAEWSPEPIHWETYLPKRVRRGRRCQVSLSADPLNHCD